MTDDEFRALVEAGPCVVMVAKSDMLRLLDERAALRQISNSTGCMDACPCWRRLRDKAAKTVEASDER
jgi:hypothetical protein